MLRAHVIDFTVVPSSSAYTKKGWFAECCPWKSNSSGNANEPSRGGTQKVVEVRPWV